MVLPYHYKSFSLRLFVSVALLNILGILVINSATYNDTAVIGRQMTGAAIGAVLMFVICVIPYQKILNYAVPIFIVCAVPVLRCSFGMSCSKRVSSPHLIVT